ncbi:MAG: 30S ribosomal protein S1 [Rhodospirillaceae bacterium]
MTTETITPDFEAAISDQNFAAMLDETFGENEPIEGSVIKGTIIGIEGDSVLVDVGLKSEGRIPIREFGRNDDKNSVEIGNIVDIYLERMEDRNGEAMLSREKARREEAWTILEKAFEGSERVTGTIFGRVKGGFTVDLSGAIAFLPGSQVDVRPIRDVNPLMEGPQAFQILKMDRRRGNIVVSRRAVMEESRAEQRAELLSGMAEGQIVDGIVKNLTDYGAFVDLGGVDGLLHVTDIAWQRITHPSEVLNVGQTVKVQVIRFNSETQRISLGMKQLQTDPWDDAEVRYPLGLRLKGRVSNITDYGAFVELEPGIEGLVHVTEMSWTKKNVHPGQIISTSQEVEVIVLDVDPQKRRISLGIKQTQENPWEDFMVNHPPGSEIEGEIRNITEFGLFVGLSGDIDGMVHLSDLSWDKQGEQAISDYQKGDVVRAKVLDIDLEKERISLGIKQLSSDPFETAASDIKKGDIVTCTVISVTDGGLEVTVAGGVPGFIKRSDLSRERSEQRGDRFAEGDRVDALVTAVDRRERRLSLSIKQHEIQEERKAMADYGSSDSGASLGDILGAAMKKAEEGVKSDEIADPPDTEAPTNKN